MNCAYCGVPAGTVDHLRSSDVSLTHRNRADKNSGVARPGTVFACNECNATLGHCDSEELSKRATYLEARYTSKYATLLKAPDWSEDQLDDLGSDLRSSVIEGLARRDIVRHRLAQLRGRSGLGAPGRALQNPGAAPGGVGAGAPLPAAGDPSQASAAVVRPVGDRAGAAARPLWSDPESGWPSGRRG